MANTHKVPADYFLPNSVGWKPCLSTKKHFGLSSQSDNKVVTKTKAIKPWLIYRPYTCWVSWRII